MSKITKSSSWNYDNIIKKNIKVETPLTYHRFNAEGEKPLLIFLHGYADSAASLLKRAFPILDDRYEILAPNSIYLVPQKKENEWLPAFSWYFGDFEKSIVWVSPEISATYLQNLVDDLNLSERPKILIGFSQGGFMMSYLLKRLKNIKRLISIGSAYLGEHYSERLIIPADSIHGVDDDIITLKFSKQKFDNFKAINPLGVFYEVPGLGHSMNQAGRDILNQIISDTFK